MLFNGRLTNVFRGAICCIQKGYTLLFRLPYQSQKVRKSKAKLKWSEMSKLTKLPVPLTISWCKKNKKIVQEMNAKFDKEKSPSHWHRKGSPDYWMTRLAAHKHRAKKLGRKCAWANEAEIERIFRDCPENMTIHHDFPVQGEFISGLEHELNLRYLTLSENCSIGNNFKPRRSIIYRAEISLF